MEVVLTPELEVMVERRIASGRFGSVMEVIADALKTQEEAELDFEERRAALDAELGRRVEALDRGEYLTLEEVRAHFAQRSEALRRRVHASAA